MPRPSSKARSRKHHPLRRGLSRGFTLVEILVVLVILVIGMLAISRIFPEGFANINVAASTTMAGALARLQAEYIEKHAEGPWDATLAVDYRTGKILLGQRPQAFLGGLPYIDNPVKGAGSTPPNDPRFTGPNLTRRIIGEQTKVPPPIGPYGPLGESVSLHSVMFSPIYSAQRMGNIALGVSAYSGTPMRRIVIPHLPTSQPEWDALYAQLNDANSYAIDRDARTLYFRITGYPRTFKLDCQYRVIPTSPGGTYAIGSCGPDQCLYLPPSKDSDDPADPSSFIQGYNLVMGPPSDGANAGRPADCVFTPLPHPSRDPIKEPAQLDPDTDFIYRRLDRIDNVATAVSTADPFQFKVYDSLFGLIGFNPRLAALTPPGQDQRGYTVRLDYDVDDWSIMREDVEVPTAYEPTAGGAQLHSIKLAVPTIKQVGDMEDVHNFIGAGGGPVDTTLEYQGLIRQYPASGAVTGSAPARAGTNGIDIVIVDVETGYQLTNDSLDLRDVSDFGDVDYNSGVIHLTEDAEFTPPGNLGAMGAMPIALKTGGRHLRVYYRTYNDFGVAAIKPFSRYYFGFAPTPRAQETERDYGFGYLLFHPGEAGRNVAIDYIWRSYTVDSGGNRVPGEFHNEAGEQQKIQPPQPESMFGPTPGYAGRNGMVPGGAHWVRVAHSDIDPSKGSGDTGGDADVVPGSVMVTGVRGVSYQTYVVWRDAGRQRHLERTAILSKLQAR
jgi:prepilin-type N-terminal cleavage/methylation domain-containing protein